MGQETEQQILDTLREIRDGQRELVAQLEAQRVVAQEQMQKSRFRAEESMGLQREALRRQKSITLIAVPGILACIAAISYLIYRYF